jgi:hypothetical protein
MYVHDCEQVSCADHFVIASLRGMHLLVERSSDWAQNWLPNESRQIHAGHERKSFIWQKRVPTSQSAICLPAAVAIANSGRN